MRRGRITAFLLTTVLLMSGCQSGNQEALTNVQDVCSIGGLNEWLFIECVDWDLDFRILKLGRQMLQSHLFQWK